MSAPGTAPGPAVPVRAPGEVVLRAENISVSYAGRRPIRAVRDVSLELRRGEVLGIAGESGCGKSTLAYAIAQLLRPPAELTSGTVRFFGRDGAEAELTTLLSDQLRTFRSTRIGMVFQSAMNALNPVTSIGRQFRDIFREHAPGLDGTTIAERAASLLDMVGIDRGRLRSFPHELSGGMRQRVVIAMALALDPEILIMDEPTTALDVVVQQEILDEIARLREALGFSVIFITHDLSLLLEISDTLAIMYAGKIVEYGPTEMVALAPGHPYTLGLLRSFPDMRGQRRELRGVPGTPPDLAQPIRGCAFAPRCDHALPECQSVPPALLPLRGPRAEQGWRAACHLHNGELCPQGPPAELGYAALSTPAGPGHGSRVAGACVATAVAEAAAPAGTAQGGVSAGSGLPDSDPTGGTR